MLLYSIRELKRTVDSMYILYCIIILIQKIID